MKDESLTDAVGLLTGCWTGEEEKKLGLFLPMGETTGELLAVLKRFGEGGSQSTAGICRVSDCG